MGVACSAIPPRSSGGQQLNDCYALSSGGSHCERAGSYLCERVCSIRHRGLQPRSWQPLLFLWPS